jgi:hypothetical protein
MEMECRLAKADTSDPVHVMLNTAWRKFWADPAGYHRWETKAVEELFALCEGKGPAASFADGAGSARITSDMTGAGCQRSMAGSAAVRATSDTAE